MRPLKFLFLLISTILSVTTDVSLQCATLEGSIYLSKIRDQLEEGISEQTSGLWPRGQELHNQADSRLMKLYQFKTTYPSTIVDITIEHIESFLYSLSSLQTFELSQQSCEVDEIKKEVQDHLAKIQMKKLLQPAELKFMLDANKFIIFITDEFLPEFPVYGESESWVEYFKNLVLKPYTEYPFLTGVGSTLAAIWAWSKLTESEADVNKTINATVHDALCTNCTCSECPCSCHAKPKKTTPTRQSTRMAPPMDMNVYLEQTDQEIKELPELSKTDYSVTGISCTRQVGALCTYHAILNARLTLQMLSTTKEKSFPEALGKILTDDTLKATYQHTLQKNTVQRFREQWRHSRQFSTVDLETFKGQTLDEGLGTSFAEFMLTEYSLSDTELNPIKQKEILQNPDRDDYYFTLLDYRQSTAMRTNIKYALKFLEKLSTPKLVSDLAEKLKTHKWDEKVRIEEVLTTVPKRCYEMTKDEVLNPDGTRTKRFTPSYYLPTEFPKNDANITLDDFNGMLSIFVKKSIKTNSWINAIKAYQDNKILFIPWLAFGGTNKNGVGHWTFLIIIPHTHKLAKEGKTTVYHFDSLGSGNYLPSLCEKFLYECINFKLPTDEEAKKAIAINNLIKFNLHEILPQSDKSLPTDKDSKVKDDSELGRREKRPTKFGKHNEV
jgi:hypothetical protein